MEACDRVRHALILPTGLAIVSAMIRLVVTNLLQPNPAKPEHSRKRATDKFSRAAALDIFRTSSAMADYRGSWTNSEWSRHPPKPNIADDDRPRVNSFGVSDERKKNDAPLGLPLVTD